MIKLSLLLCLALLVGCVPMRPLKPGSSGIRAFVGTNGLTEFSSQMKQPENPAQSANQTFKRTVQNAGTTTTEEATTTVSAAQKDTAREIGAKLASLKGVVWLGVVLFLFGLASIFYPPLKLIIGSVTTSATISAGGLALIILPTLIVGNELLILGGVALVVGAWFLAHRHGRLQGMVNMLAQPMVTQPTKNVFNSP